VPEAKLYKILEAGRSCHGGDLAWSLPTKHGRGWKPGSWHEVGGDLKICNRGLHVTDKPFNWYTWKCEAYEAEADGIVDRQGDKCVAGKVRLVKPVAHPDWWAKAHDFVEREVTEINWLAPDGRPAKHWKIYNGETMAAAWDAAWAAARAAAGAAARAAARDAALYTYTHHVCSDLKLDERHVKHAAERWEVWRKGYGLYGDVGGVLYVYAAKEKR
jgi:hypothetical protein